MQSLQSRHFPSFPCSLSRSINVFASSPIVCYFLLENGIYGLSSVHIQLRWGGRSNYLRKSSQRQHLLFTHFEAYCWWARVFQLASSPIEVSAIPYELCQPTALSLILMLLHRCVFFRALENSSEVFYRLLQRLSSSFEWVSVFTIVTTWLFKCRFLIELFGI